MSVDLLDVYVPADDPATCDACDRQTDHLHDYDSETLAGSFGHCCLGGDADDCPDAAHAGHGCMSDPYERGAA